MRKWLVTFLFLTLGSGALAAVNLRGPAQALWPGWNGLHEIAPGVFADDPALDDENIALWHTAQRRVAGYLGRFSAKPRVVLCSTQQCSTLFLRPNGPSGIAWGQYLIIVSPNGRNQMILTHELTHAEMHINYNILDILWPRFPAWFDEGLAGLISQDARLTPPDEIAKARIEQASNFIDWQRAIAHMGWREAYGAALQIVEEMARSDDGEKLRQLIERVAKGEDFDAVRTELFWNGSKT